jgi:tetratricopeptide (TPR) repeat protein
MSSMARARSRCGSPRVAAVAADRDAPNWYRRRPRSVASARHGGSPPNQPPSNAGIPRACSTRATTTIRRALTRHSGLPELHRDVPKLPRIADLKRIGMSYYNQSKWLEAKAAFEKVISDYPQQPERLSDAYYKLGMTFERLNQIDNAKKAYDTVVQKYTNTKSFPLANQALQRLTKR